MELLVELLPRRLNRRVPYTVPSSSGRFSRICICCFTLFWWSL